MQKLPALLVLTIVSACATSPEEEDGIDDPFPDGKADGSSTAGALAAANTLSYSALVGAGLTKTAANNILKHRQGPDGKDGTADDNLFDTLPELDAVPYVGPITLRKLVAVAKKLGLDNVTTKAKCVEGTRSFLIVSSGGYLQGRFVDFDGSIDTFSCVPWTLGTIKWRCYGDPAHPPFDQINLMRNAYNQAVVEFNLVSVKNEPGGGDILFSLNCSSASGF